MKGEQILKFKNKNKSPKIRYKGIGDKFLVLLSDYPKKNKLQ